MTGDLCLLRCADLTLVSRNSYLEVFDSEYGSSIDQVSSTYPFHRHYHLNDPFLHDIAFVTKTIRLLKVQAEDGFSYDARQVSLSIKEKYEID